MSWGERSCEHYGCSRATIATCNVGCPHYKSNGKPPDSGPNAPRLTVSTPPVYRVDIGPPPTAAEIDAWRRRKAITVGDVKAAIDSVPSEMELIRSGHYERISVDALERIE